MTSQQKRKAGFTLIELIITIAILAILASAAIATFGGTSKAAEDARSRTNAGEVVQAINTWNELQHSGGHFTLNDLISRNGDYFENPGNGNLVLGLILVQPPDEMTADLSVTLSEEEWTQLVPFVDYNEQNGTFYIKETP